jgi:hypothetical protein
MLELSALLGSFTQTSRLLRLTTALGTWVFRSIVTSDSGLS